MLRGWAISEGGVGGNDVGDVGVDAESVDKGGRAEDGEDGRWGRIVFRALLFQQLLLWLSCAV